MNMEYVIDQETMTEVNKRWREIKEGKVKGLSEEEFLRMMKECGVDISGITKML